MIPTESNPALSANVLGITSKDLANASTTSYLAPLMDLDSSLMILESSISIEPAPPITLLAFIALLTTIILSLRDLSASLMNYSAPPLKIIVAD